MTVRGYRDADLESCRALWVELTQWHRDLFAAPEIGGDDPGASFDRHLEAVGAANIWVAEHEGEIIGLVGMIPAETEAELEPIVVSPKHRGCGVGRALIDVVVESARTRGLRTVYARPVARNAQAVQFFHTNGFDVLGQIEVMLDLTDSRPWRRGERVALRDFRV